MKILRKRLTLLVVCVLIASLLAACAPNNPPAASTNAAVSAAASVSSAKTQETPAVSTATATGYPLQVTDILGTAVTVKQEPKTVVSLAPNITEILFALGEGDKVKGADINSNYPADAAKIEKVGDFNGPDLEKITALKPDVVFAGNTLQKDAIASLEKLGVTVVAAEATDYDGIFNAVSLVASVMGKKDAGEALNKKIKTDVDAVAAKAAALAKHPSAYFVISFGSMGNWTSGPKSFVNTLLEKAGFTCTTADGDKPWMEYQLEKLLTKKPDILLLASDVGKPEDLKKETGYKDLNAVRNGKVYSVNSDIISRPGVRAGEAMNILYDINSKNQ